jgi:hypothetical protein
MGNLMKMFGGGQMGMGGGGGGGNSQQMIGKLIQGIMGGMGKSSAPSAVQPPQMQRPNYHPAGLR